jgi:hypothetical protein
VRDGDGFGEFLVGVPRRFEKEVEEDGVAIAVVVAGPAEVEGQGSEERDEGDKGDGEVPRAVLDECGPGKDNPAGGKERGEEVAVGGHELCDAGFEPFRTLDRQQQDDSDRKGQGHGHGQPAGAGGGERVGDGNDREEQRDEEAAEEGHPEACAGGEVEGEDGEADPGGSAHEADVTAGPGRLAVEDVDRGDRQEGEEDEVGMAADLGIDDEPDVGDSDEEQEAQGEVPRGRIQGADEGRGHEGDAEYEGIASPAEEDVDPGVQIAADAAGIPGCGEELARAGQELRRWLDAPHGGSEDDEGASGHGITGFHGGWR